MEKLRVAVLGASGIGKYHVRELNNAGADVFAILGKTKKSSIRTAKKLKEEFNISVNPYSRLKELLENENLDAVSICTPPEIHEEQIRTCLKNNLHVMCEKPLIETFNNNYEESKKLFDLAEKRKKILTVNTQWASIADYLRAEVNSVKSLSIYMEPAKREIDMLRDHLPHTNSVLIKLIPNGKAQGIEFLTKNDKATTVRFTYENEENSCEVKYDLKFKADRPRDIIFSINGESFKRQIYSGYKQVFVSNKETFEIEDPFTISIGRFLGACKGSNILLVDKKKILENIFLTDQIISAYISQDIKKYKVK